MMKKNIIKICIILLLVIIAITFYTNPDSVKNDSQVTEESFQDEMQGTWSTFGEKYQLKFYYDENNIYRVAYYERKGLEKNQIFDYPYRNLKVINDGKYAYEMDLDALMENMGMKISFTKDHARMTNNLVDGRVMFKSMW
ncbi:hypothetical protein FXF36_01955 [Pseudobutyrivibrio xylanivorans]|uniref:Uncharacterized protein n=2 Tax=Pseudobutyrivibrio xylanivorans TaxID=185007 RepID=A0A5P6VMZ5_PSEXY|nr:hypothetical protein FXF36_01955 [Pseudobutyrivibrio xylanivorans]